MKKTSTLLTKLILSAMFVLIMQFTVRAQCNAAYTYSIAGNVVTFVNTSTNFGPNTTWSWSFGDTQTSSAQNPPPHTYAAGTYTCCVGGLDASTFCADSACHIFTITASGVNEVQTINGNISNYPNPFANSTTIRYVMGESGSAEISIYDVLGNKVSTLENSTMKSAGNYETIFDATSLSQGIYFLKFTLNGRSVTEKMTVTK